MEKNKFIVNFLLKEVILKYLFCYILSVITLSVPLPEVSIYFSTHKK